MRVLWLVVALAMLVIGRVTDAHASQGARITFYDDYGTMADGRTTYLGAAACSYDLPFGTQVMLSDGFVVTCEDRGMLGYGSPTWLDIWSPSYGWGQANVADCYGSYDDVTVLRWGW